MVGPLIAQEEEGALHIVIYDLVIKTFNGVGLTLDVINTKRQTDPYGKAMKK